MFKTKYLANLYEKLIKETAGENEFHQAVFEMFVTLDPVLDDYPQLIANNIVEQLLTPERVVIKEVVWENTQRQTETNKAYRVQYNSALGVYKGGLRYSPNVSLSIFKFLAFEQTFKNALTMLPMGGGKGGADFNPRGRSEEDIKLFTEAFITTLAQFIGADIDVPAGDIGVGQKEVSIMVEKYGELKDDAYGAFTGKLPGKGGVLGRKEATGHGLIYFVEAALNRIKNDSLRGKKVIVSGSGNVALYAALKAEAYGATVVAMSDSSGYVYNAHGLDVAFIKELKEIRKQRIVEYIKHDSEATYTPNASLIWSVKCDVALPCATQNEIDADAALKLVKNNVMFVAEGANMPTTKEAVDVFSKHKLLYAPGKAANAGGVYVSGLEMMQHQEQTLYSYEKVDNKLKNTMETIFNKCYETAAKHDKKNDLLFGANLYSFLRVANKMVEKL